tara:strand:+ start:3601 stop:3894 length:294 start_codon:yes stop_codon:yes gene_type:complete
MEKTKWSDYDKYLVLSDKSNCILGGTYSHFLNFKKVLEVVKNIAHSDKSSYLHDGNIYSRKVTSADAKRILDNVLDCKWTSTISQMKLIGNQLGVKI